MIPSLLKTAPNLMGKFIGKNILWLMAAGVFFAGSLATSLPIVQAQTSSTAVGNGAYTNAMYSSTNPATPLLYSQSGQPLNTDSTNSSIGTSISPGWYYTQSGAQIYYYGNGITYMPSTGLYSTTANSPTGESMAANVPANPGTTAAPVGSSGTPVLYDQSDIALNPNGTALGAGWYYNQSGVPVYYYGNGAYYDPSTNSYGGNYINNGGTVSSNTTAPGVPDTGAGGDSAPVWILLLVTGSVAIGGGAYLGRLWKKEMQYET